MLYVDLESNVLWAGRQHRKLSSMEAEFLYIMIENIGRVMPYERIATRLWGHMHDDPVNARNSINGYAFKARRILESMKVPATLEHYGECRLRLVFGETDPDDEYIVRCLKHRDSIEKFLRDQSRVRK